MSNKNFTVIGMQWGDEGKGKIVDYLAESFDVITRFQGGNNAGHTLKINGKVYKLSILPSGIIRKGKISIIGSGAVIDLENFTKEIKTITENGITIDPSSLYVSDICTIILPLHKKIDQLCEGILHGKSQKIGTTGRGIGPAYASKIHRNSIRVCDLMHDDILKEKLYHIFQFYDSILTKYDVDLNEFNVETTFEHIKKYRVEIIKYQTYLPNLMHDFMKAGKKILFEGAQGLMLDIDIGTYPFVTSSNTNPMQAYIGSGISNEHPIQHIGVMKAYTTRVGMGPFPTETNDDTTTYIQTKGHEFGTVTGRQRRCGWFDVVLIKHMSKICSINYLIMTKIDVLSGLKQLKIATSYDLDGKKLDYLPSSNYLQTKIQPVYTTLDGWEEDISQVRDYNDLPLNAKKYIDFIEEFIGIKIVLISVDPEREGIIKKDPNTHIIN